VSAERVATPVLWHELECGGYTADLAVWEALAAEGGDPILDLGCGAGRVALHLARRGHAVIGLDADPALLAAFEERADGLAAEAVSEDAREFQIDREFGLVLAPMQLIQLLADTGERAGCLRSTARHLRPGGLAAFAIVEQLPAGAEVLPPLPDAREVDGWVYSSLPLETAVDGERMFVRRLRQSVSPAGDLSEEVDEVPIRALSAGALEREAAAAGLRPSARIEIAATEDHVGSTAVVLKRET
jgi:SAM-dependent methyltransferase